jgi:hypothetical protein
LTAPDSTGLWAARVQSALCSPDPARSLFIDALGWEESRSSLARLGPWAAIESSEPAPPAGQVVTARRIAGGLELAFPLPHARFSVLPLLIGSLAEGALEALARWRVRPGAAEWREPGAPAAEGCLRGFIAESEALIERWTPMTRSPKLRTLEEGARRLRRWAIRAAAFRLVEQKGWLPPGWLAMQAAAESNRPLGARLASAWSLGLCSTDPAEAARLEGLVGRVPALGWRFALLEPEENLDLPPEEFLRELILGPVGRWAWTPFEPGPSSEIAAVSPEAIGRMADPGAKAIWREEPAPEGAFFDPEAGAGGRLVRTLIHRLGSLADRERLKKARRLISSEIQGASAEPDFALAARLRLALAALAGCREPGLILDLEHAVRIAAPQVAEGRGTLVEGPHCELKGSFEWSPREEARSEQMRLGALKTLAAFLNSEGGQLWIGVDNMGRPVGLEGDLGGGPERGRLDTLEMRIREAIKNSLDPAPVGMIEISFPRRSGVIVGRIQVRSQPGITYLVRRDPKSGRMLDEIYVRDGARTLNLDGRIRDRFVLDRMKGISR